MYQKFNIRMLRDFVLAVIDKRKFDWFLFSTPVFLRPKVYLSKNNYKKRLTWS